MTDRMNDFDSKMDSDEDDGCEISNEHMTTVSRHHFGDESDKPSFSISIIENIKEEYGLFVWPCSVILAEYVWQQRDRFPGTNVVELGAGTSLPGLVAAKVGSNVTLTDDSDRVEVLENMKRVCELNKLKCQVMGLTWGVWDASIFDLQPQIILGADVFYDASAFDDLFATITYLLQNSPGSIFITTYHNRSGHHLIEFLMVKWGLKCVKLIDAFSFLSPYKATELSGNIQLAEIILSSEPAKETSASMGK
ncbi:Methyltransferase-like protein 23 [Melia azedarach]|uniref:Methyltransferase-like protein 23 n=1 Tax=Melia azedarach TaxID=155640 RepID=A0ACC1XT82_MELAZ|nr:Methyltransferase-like protein 23 [Melia azedarach]